MAIRLCGSFIVSRIIQYCHVLMMKHLYVFFFLPINSKQKLYYSNPFQVSFLQLFPFFGNLVALIARFCFFFPIQVYLLYSMPISEIVLFFYLGECQYAWQNELSEIYDFIITVIIALLF